MYVFGIEIPLVEVILAMGVIGLIILFEVAVVLLLITYLMKRSKKLEDRIGMLVDSLVSLNKEELKELQKIYDLEGKKEVKKYPLVESSERKPSKTSFFTFARFFKKGIKEKNVVRVKPQMRMSKSKVQKMLSKVFGKARAKTKRVTAKEKRKLYATFVENKDKNRLFRALNKIVKKIKK